MKFTIRKLFVIFLVTLACFWVMLSTTCGKLTFIRAVALLAPGQLQYTIATHAPSSGLQLAHLVYKKAQWQINIEQLHLRWSIHALTCAWQKITITHINTSFTLQEGYLQSFINWQSHRLSSFVQSKCAGGIIHGHFLTSWSKMAPRQGRLYLRAIHPEQLTQGLLPGKINLHIALDKTSDQNITLRIEHCSGHIQQQMLRGQGYLQLQENKGLAHHLHVELGQAQWQSDVIFTKDQQYIFWQLVIPHLEKFSRSSGQISAHAKWQKQASVENGYMHLALKSCSYLDKTIEDGHLHVHIDETTINTQLKFVTPFTHMNCCFRGILSPQYIVWHIKQAHLMHNGVHVTLQQPFHVTSYYHSHKKSLTPNALSYVVLCPQQTQYTVHLTHLPIECCWWNHGQLVRFIHDINLSAGMDKQRQQLQLNTQSKLLATRVHLPMSSDLSMMAAAKYLQIKLRVQECVPNHHRGFMLQCMSRLRRPHCQQKVLQWPQQTHLNVQFPDLSIMRYLSNEWQDSQGRLAINAHAQGQWPLLQFNGQALLENGQICLSRFGCCLHDMHASIKSTTGKAIHYALHAHSKKGPLRVQGDAKWSRLGYHTTAQIQGEHVLLMDTPDCRLHVSPNLAIHFFDKQLSLTGHCILTNGYIRPHMVSTIQSLSKDVILDGENTQAFSVNSDIQCDIDTLDVDYFGLKASLTGKLHFKHNIHANDRLLGQLKILKGQYHALGEPLVITQGALNFTSGRIDNPNIRLVAYRHLSKQLPASPKKVTVEVTGSLQQPVIKLSTDTPQSTTNQQLRYLLLGTDTMNQTSSSLWSVMLAPFRQSESRSWQNSLEQALGLDELRIDLASVMDKNSDHKINPLLSFKKQINPHISLHYGVSMSQPLAQLLINYRINQWCSIEADASFANRAIDIWYHS